MPAIKRFSETELEQLLDDLESDRMERKESLKGDARSKVRDAVCAFANDLPNHNQPGVLFVGAKDDGTPSGEVISDELLTSLAGIATDGTIMPLPVLLVEKRILKKAEMAVVVVYPSDSPPVRYQGRILIRTGSRRAVANRQEERILIEKRRFKNLPFDLYPVGGARLSDLSRLLFENEYLPQAFALDVLEANGRTYEERLASCRMIASPTEATPTCIGLLAVGKNPQDFFPGAYIQFLRINGQELADPVTDEAMIGGTIAQMLRTADEKLRAHNKTQIDIISAVTEVRKQDYPLAAVTQILHNAILHRTYEDTNAPVRLYWFNDRIEISSPGGPYGNVTIENFGQSGVTDYRNPNVADVLKTYGFVQKFGRGIAVAKSEMKKNGNPEPQFIVNSTSVLCVLRKV